MNSLLLAAFLLHPASANSPFTSTGDAETYRKVAKSDCSGKDISPQPACSGQNQAVAVLETCCDKTPLCGGFNTHGVIKDETCSEHVHPSPTTDLYLSTSAPPTPGLPPPMPWPLPSDVSMGTTTVQLSHDFAISTVAGTSCPTLDTAVLRYQSQVVGLHIASPAAKAHAPLLHQLIVQVANIDETYPQLNTTSAEHEAYMLTIPADGSAATISAETIWGAMWGMESFSQLVRFNFTAEAYSIVSAPVVLRDTPRFPHRGLMIDTSRHFLPLASIRSIIDSLAYAKLNVLHIHASDEQSFPMQIKSYPKLWDAAYSSQERYTQADLASVVEYARLRGIRVMVEFDVPGHSKAICKSYPEACTTCTAKSGSTLPLNPSRNATFDLMESLLLEMTGGSASTSGSPHGLFPGNMIHLGGDEVDADCFNRDPQVAAWMIEQGLNASEAYGLFTQRVNALAKAQGRRVVQWAEVYANVGTKLDKNAIVHVWRSAHIARQPAFNRYIDPAQVVADGYQTLINIGYDSTTWYLDNTRNNWTSFYRKEPCDNITQADCKKYVLGGEGEMWGEKVDASDLVQTVWPRLAAVAERLWSPQNTTNEQTALPRIQAFRCLLNKRGIYASPVLNAEAREGPSGTGSCYAQ